MAKEHQGMQAWRHPTRASAMPTRHSQSWRRPTPSTPGGHRWRLGAFSAPRCRCSCGRRVPGGQAQVHPMPASRASDTARLVCGGAGRGCTRVELKGLLHGSAGEMLWVRCRLICHGHMPWDCRALACLRSTVAQLQHVASMRAGLCAPVRRRGPSRMLNATVGGAVECNVFRLHL